MFTEADLIFVYTRKDAIEDGVLVDANVGELDEVTRQFFKIPVAMTVGVWELMYRAVANKKYMNDWKGVWHDIMWMCYLTARRYGSKPEFVFRVIITGTGRRRIHELRAVIGAVGPDDPAPCMTIMLPNED